MQYQFANAQNTLVTNKNNGATFGASAQGNPEWQQWQIWLTTPGNVTDPFVAPTQPSQPSIPTSPNVPGTPVIIPVGVDPAQLAIWHFRNDVRTGKINAADVPPAFSILLP